MQTIVESAAGPLTESDTDVGSAILWPRYGNQAVAVNQGGYGGNFNMLSQTATVTAAQFDPADNKVHIRFAFAPVVGRGIGSISDPYYFIQVTDLTQGTILYTDFATAGNENQPWQTAPPKLEFTAWQLVSIAAAAPAINVGDSIELQIVAACGGNPQGDGELAKVWVDGVGANVPGISVEGSAQASAGPGATATYTLNYQNQGSQTETNVMVNFPLPPNTTYQSLNTPYGVICSTPGVGASGTVSCNVGSLSVGASGSLSITLAFPNAASGALAYRNYGISSDQETTLLGPPIFVASLGTASALYGPESGAGSDIVDAPPGVAWSAGANASWITLTGSSGTGPGLATFTYAANAGATRTGTITFTASTFQLTLTVTQAGAGYAQASVLNTLVSTASGLGQPYGVALDGSGDVYIADFGNSALEEWNTTNGLATLFALTSSVTPSDDSSPVGVALDGLGNVYAASNSASYYRSIYEWNAASGTPQALEISQSNPLGVAADNAGNLYIANSQELLEWSPSVGIHNNVLDSGALAVAVDLIGNVYESVQGTGIKELPVSGQSSVLFYPGTDSYGLAVDGAGNVYAATQGVNANAIVQWNPATQQATTLVSSGLTTPQGVAVDGVGNVYIADSGSNTVYELPYAFVPAASVTETAAAGSDQLAPVLPATAPFVAASDSTWLTIGSIANGVVSFSFTQNLGPTARTAHITVLGLSIPVTQSGQTAPSIMFSTAASYAYGQSFMAAASSNSTGAFTYSLVSGPASVTSAGMVTITGEGPVTIQASQAEAGIYLSGAQQAEFMATQATSSATLTLMVVKSGTGSAASLEAVVSPQFSGTPTGSVTFYDGATPLDTVPLSGGSAGYTTPTLKHASNSFSAKYSGDTNFIGTNSNAISLAVPVTVSLTSTASVTFTIGAKINIRVNFSRAVNVTGTPQLALNSGGTASYSTGSGTSSLVFTYTVASPQSTTALDASSTTALTLNGGTIEDTSSVAANLTLPTPGAPGSLSANTTIIINTTQYQLTTSVLPAGGGTVLANPTRTLNVTPPLPAGTYLSGSMVQISATPASEYIFSDWTGSAPTSPNNPLTIMMNGPVNETANFTLNTVGVTINTSPQGLLVSVDNATPAAAPVNLTWVIGKQHRIATTTPQNNGTLYNFTGWSDMGAISHVVTATASTTSYTASFAAPPTISKSFMPNSIPLGGFSTLSFRIANPSATLTQTGVFFRDDFPTGMQVAGTPDATNTCGGTFTAPAGAIAVHLNGGSLAPSATCSLSVLVKATTVAVLNNTTSAIVSTNAGTGATSNTASLTVNAPATITLPQHASMDAGATRSSSLAFPSSNTAGNFIAVVVRGGVANEVFTVQDSAGNMYQKAVQLPVTGSPGGESLAIYYAESIAGGANTVTVSQTVPATLRFAILEYSGIAATNALDRVAAAQGTSASPNSPSVTTTTSGDLLLAGILSVDSEVYTPGNGYTAEEAVPAEPNTKLLVEQQIQSADGPVSAGATLGGIDPWGVVLAAFHAAPATVIK